MVERRRAVGGRQRRLSAGSPSVRSRRIGKSPLKKVVRRRHRGVLKDGDESGTPSGSSSSSSSSSSNSLQAAEVSHGSDASDTTENSSMNSSSSDSQDGNDFVETTNVNIRKRDKNLVHNLEEEQNEELKRARNVLLQQSFYDHLLNTRIRMQPLLKTMNCLPREKSIFDSLANGELESESSQGLRNLLQEARSEVLKLIRNCVALHYQCASNGKLFKVPESIGLDEDESGVIDCESVWKQVENVGYNMEKWKLETINKWGERANLASGQAIHASQKFKAINQSVEQQINAILRDMPRLKRRIHLKRSEYSPTGIEENEENTIPWGQVDEEAIDDSDFYQQLLRQVLDSTSGNAPGDVSGGNTFAALRATRQRKNVDRRASKGRKLRFVVHDKLVGFVPALPEQSPPALDELIAGLFGASNAVQQNGNTSIQ